MDKKKIKENYINYEEIGEKFNYKKEYEKIDFDGEKSISYKTYFKDIKTIWLFSYGKNKKLIEKKQIL